MCRRFSPRFRIDYKVSPRSLLVRRRPSVQPTPEEKQAAGAQPGEGETAQERQARTSPAPNPADAGGQPDAGVDRGSPRPADLSTPANAADQTLPDPAPGPAGPHAPYRPHRL